MFNELQMDNSIENERDILGGGGVLETGLYDCTIEMAYGSKSTGGAKAINLHLKTDDGKLLRQTIYVTSKTGQNFYEKNGQKNYLPGFLLATNLCLLTVKKELHQVTFEEKVINLYDFDAKKELPTRTLVAVELIGQRITVGVIKEVVDKTAKDAAGKYLPTGETREQNEIDKFFRIDDGITVAELRAKEPAKFKEQWGTKNTGVTRNKAKGANTSVNPGSTSSTGNATKPKAPSLFED